MRKVPTENIILTGFMGCGKTSIGIRLSYRLRVPFLDTDKWIEKEQGRSISRIFAEDGEEAFRQMETQALRELLAQEGRQVIATGGGLPMREENRLLLKKLGTVVYLRLSPETVWERLCGDTSRPLLCGPDPEGEIRRLMKLREPFYLEGADAVVDVDGKAYEAVLDEIVERVKKGRQQ